MSEVGMRMRQAKIGEFIEEELWVGQEILPFGADIKSKVEGILRIAFQNINGISYNTDKTADEEIDAMETRNQHKLDDGTTSPIGNSNTTKV